MVDFAKAYEGRACSWKVKGDYYSEEADLQKFRELEEVKKKALARNLWKQGSKQQQQLALHP